MGPAGRDGRAAGGPAAGGRARAAADDAMAGAVTRRRPGTDGRPSCRTGSGSDHGEPLVRSVRRRARRDVFEFGRSFPFDRRLFEDDIRGSLAWVEAIAAAGAIDAADAARDRRRAARRARARRAATRRFVDGPDEDVHAFVERKLVERIGEAGKRLHTGPLAQRAGVGRSAALPDAPDPGAAGGARRAWSAPSPTRRRRAGDAPMPAYTHLRRAQPVLVAHFWLAHVAALRRDHEYFDVARHAADVLPLGSGAVAGTSYPLDVRRAGRAASGFSRVARQQHRRLVGPRLRVGVPPRLLAGHGAPEPAGRGPHHLHRRGVPLLRAVRRGGDRQQPDAAEEEPRPARAHSRQVGARASAATRAGWRR